MVKPSAQPRRALRYGHTIAIDMRQEVDCSGLKVDVLDILDIGTRFSMYIALPSKESRGVAQALFMFWCSIAGPPEFMIHDMGGEFQSDVIEIAEHWGCKPKVGPAEAPWPMRSLSATAQCWEM